ncbi:hypothetical protein [Desulfomicrobium escambiense]|uniref:hypothetical protein n=1 Tax=Desulfomicrobium escambiense TaxID=29503 RepID=UPI0012EC2A5E|nr:hypothetical protein [Desulfomicrobium escambiense]
MSLTPTITSVHGQYRKMERERYRTIHCKNSIHRADHFINFCITAHSIQDYILEHINKIQKSEADSQKEIWNGNPIIKAVVEISNSSKHFKIRNVKTKKPRQVTTKNVKKTKSKFVEIRESSDGTIWTNIEEVNDYSVHISDGSRHNLDEFMKSVLAFWKAELKSHGVIIRRQSCASLIGE